MPKEMSMKRRDELTSVLQKTCVSFIPEKAFEEAEKRLRKKPVVAKFMALAEKIECLYDRIEEFKDKIQKDIDGANLSLAEINDSSDSTHFTAYLNGPIPRSQDIKVLREENGVKINLITKSYRSDKDSVFEPIDAKNYKTASMIDEAVRAAKLCITEQEMITLIRDTVELLKSNHPA
jgi:hypothetical protein